MNKCKVLSWNSAFKHIKLQTKDHVLTVRATSNLMSRLLLVARSSREVNLEEVIGKYEFSTIDRTLMKPTGSLHPTLDKSKVIAILENLPVTSPESVIEEPHNPTDIDLHVIRVDQCAS